MMLDGTGIYLYLAIVKYERIEQKYLPKQFV
jgi:hypothetical protein